MKKINIFIGIGLGIIIIISGWIVFSGKINLSPFQKEIGVSQEDAKIKQEIVLIIDNAEGKPQTFTTKFKEGMTAFDLLKMGSVSLGLALKTKTYDIGIFIEAIGDKENGQDGKYWLYYVNGEMPQVAADKKTIKPGDKVEFKFEKSPF